MRCILSITVLFSVGCTLILDPLDELHPADSGRVDANLPDADRADDDADVTTNHDADRSDSTDGDSDDGDLDETGDGDDGDIEPVCHPDCLGRACGADGCGDICGDGCREGENCTSEGTCIVADVDCGDAYEVCCAGRMCHDGLCQSNWFCAPCGTEDQMCCIAEPRCAPGLTCIGFGAVAGCL